MLQQEIQVSKAFNTPAYRIVPLEKERLGEKVQRFAKTLLKRFRAFKLSILRKFHGKAQHMCSQEFCYEIRRLKHDFPFTQIQQLPNDQYQITLCKKILLCELQSFFNYFKDAAWDKKVFLLNFHEKKKCTCERIYSYLELPLLISDDFDQQPQVLLSDQVQLQVVVQKR